MRTMQEVDVGASQMDGAGNDGNNENDENNLAIEQLAEMQAAQTMERPARGSALIPTCLGGLAAWSAMKATRPRPSGRGFTSQSRGWRPSMCGS
jgi:hypothetical protein